VHQEATKATRNLPGISFSSFPSSSPWIASNSRWCPPAAAAHGCPHDLERALVALEAWCTLQLRVYPPADALSGHRSETRQLSFYSRSAQFLLDD
jgi:hypothetical protein